MPAVPVEDWLPATARVAAIDHNLKAGEPLFRIGDKTAGLYEVITGRCPGIAGSGQLFGLKF